MKFITLAAALAAAVPAVLGQSLTINTPTDVVVCEPTQLKWSGGTAPYYLSVIPAGQVSATPYESFPPQNGTSYTWTVDLEAGLSINFALKDSSGDQQYSSLITIQAGSSTSCLSSSGATATVSSGASPTSSSGSSGSGSTTTGTSGSGSSTSTSSSASASSTSSSTNGAGRLSVSSAFGVAGVMGLVGAMLF